MDAWVATQTGKHPGYLQIYRESHVFPWLVERDENSRRSTRCRVACLYVDLELAGTGLGTSTCMMMDISAGETRHGALFVHTEGKLRVCPASMKELLASKFAPIFRGKSGSWAAVADCLKPRNNK